jgi:hypothetical protein
MFNKKIETQITHLASMLSATNHEQIKGISTRGGKVMLTPFLERVKSIGKD